jgi:hypothetical protein
MLFILLQLLAVMLTKYVLAIMLAGYLTLRHMLHPTQSGNPVGVPVVPCWSASEYFRHASSQQDLLLLVCTLLSSTCLWEQ